ncbi:MAG: tRNA (adenosine(37)-N6)-threonylcarbamoyltransferase complex ATPase subunit type 1 TsaE [Bacteroidota bacterium]|nr:tRNA (adenosine(37)-N6)-threonylcarbamoyltransferase complex ATPase subunit type 1 TsaE [Bacteroidota bacterium]
MIKSIELNTINELSSVATKFIKLNKSKKVFAFFGDMGVGKTTFIKALCNEMGVIDIVTSPSFALVNEYHTNNNETIFHFDFYRIKNIEEAYDFGYEDYFYSEHYCFIEWPEKIAELLPDDVVYVKIKEEENGKRLIQFNQN